MQGKYISKEERRIIKGLIQTGSINKVIVEILWRNWSTIKLELKRNYGYSAQTGTKIGKTTTSKLEGVSDQRKMWEEGFYLILFASHQMDLSRIKKRNHGIHPWFFWEIFLNSAPLKILFIAKQIKIFEGSPRRELFIKRSLLVFSLYLRGFLRAACAQANRTIGIRFGEQLT